MAPVETVNLPEEQLVHWLTDTAPARPLKVPRGQKMGAVAAGPLNDPGGLTVHLKEPASEENEPALQGRH